jgi:phage baseplate assembly protein W
MDKPFLGRGWSFPPNFVKSDNRAGVDMLSEQDDVASSLTILLGTSLGERILQPFYGCNMDELLFESMDTRLKTLMADKVETAILYNEPRVEPESVQLDDSEGLEGKVIIGIIYRIKSTNSRFNFVFPYYRLEGTDINLTTTVNLLPDKT